MFTNLENLLSQKNLSFKDYAKFLDVAEKTTYNKLKGKSEFTLKEVLKTADFLFPEYKIDYIFKEDTQPHHTQ
ncbi:MAG: DNA-binding protein [Clostridiales bacterium]